jgi:hypothetical protein
LENFSSFVVHLSSKELYDSSIIFKIIEIILAKEKQLDNMPAA